MTAVTTLLAGIRALEQAATPGPWEIDSIESGERGVFAEEHHRLGCGTSQVAGFMTKANAEFLIAARTDVPRLIQALEAVAKVHEPVNALMNPGRHERVVKVCTGCGTDDGNWQRWPCPTVRAVTATLGGGE